MAKNFAVIHNLDGLSKEQIADYLARVSEYIGLPADLNGLDTIWMMNEQGPGRSLVVYARRGTAEILRNLKGINIESLTYIMVNGSIVFTAVGVDKSGRQEIATGSKFIQNLTGKHLDDAIMTASTRALRRCTLQFTSLGILDESEVASIIGEEINPSQAAQLQGSPTVLPPPVAAPNNAPGKLVVNVPEKLFDQTLVETAKEVTKQFLGQQEQIDEAMRQLDEKATVPEEPKVEPEKKKRRKKVNTVSLDGVEAETVTERVQAIMRADSAPVEEKPPVSIPQPPPPPVPPAVEAPPPVAGMPTEAQMLEYRKRISVFTAELPASQDMGSVQKMRAFITKQSGTPPQQMTVAQWEETLGWFDAFVERNQIKNLVKYINDTLGVK